MLPSSHQIRWKRHIAIHNNSLPPFVSFVVAEPQQTRSLASAADNLPNILRRAMPPDSSQSNTTLITIENHHQSSTTNDPPESPAINPVHESDQSALGPTPTTPPVRVPVYPCADQPTQASPPVDPSNPPAALSQDPAPAPPLSNKPLWFSVFSWSADKGTSIAEVKVELDSAPEAPDTVHVCTESSGERVSFETIIAADSTGAVGDSNIGIDFQPLPKATVSVSPHSASISEPTLNKVDTPSARKEQPVSEPSFSPLPHHAPVAQSQEDTGPPVAPNTATSIFAFNFPMLAKSRPPLRDPSVERSCEPSIATPGTDVRVILLQILDFITARWTDPGNVAMPANRSNRSSHECLVDISGVEWELLRRSGGKWSTVAVCWYSCLFASSRPATYLRSFESSQPECGIKAGVGLSSDVSAMERSPLDDKKPPSVHDVDTARRGSTWYTPWSWYQPSSSVTTAVAPNMDSGPQQDPPEHSEMGPKTEETQYTGDHEAHSAPDQASPSPQDLSTARYVDYNNPIQSAISANPTGWMSFFTAKAIAMKSITYEKEDGKMEVMEIDDEMAPGPSSASSAPPMATHPSPTQVTKPPIRAQPHSSDASSPPPKTLDDKRSPVTHAVTYPETVVNDTLKRQPSPSPSKQSGVKTPTSPPPPNLVLPTWHDTFHTLPRSAVPCEPPSALSKTLQYVSGVLFSRNETPSSKGKGKGKETAYSPHDMALPRTWDVLGGGEAVDVLRGCKRVVIIGVHGWFPGTVLRTLAGEPTGTSTRFVNGIADALDIFQGEHKVKLDKVTKIPLEGEGTINRRVERLYQNLIGNKEWIDDLHDADAIFVATHSQGSVVSTHLLDRLIVDRHIHTALNADASIPASVIAAGPVASVRPPQRICCLALCGIHLGPLRYLSTSSLLQPYIQYFESTAARELFEFQNMGSAISRDYVRALRNVLDNGIKMVYIASLNDQVVGLYSGLFTSVSHPLILRALYIDGDAYHPSDFLSNLLVLLLRIRNAGLSDGGLLTHLSEVTAGSLNGIGHSTPYEELATYSLAIKYLFLTDSRFRNTG
ncbi:hypothetical protein J3R82DRAFT_9208 [Butyriboletus roseoflavus]|nr:hypothetical protein J3R82DRAFT_9208 [Butyriboletus roseoflavus]